MRIRSFILALVVGSMLYPLMVEAAGKVSEYSVKAAFIYNFARFTQWPASMEEETKRSIEICVLGEDALSGAISALKDSSPSLRAMRVRSIPIIAQAQKGCHIVFIGNGEEAHVKEYLAELKTTPVLTVSDMPNFVEQGGMIGFVMETSKIKIAINSRAAEEAGLKFDAQLLEIAVSVIH